MEFNEFNTRPPSTQAIFRQQVERQTNECDFTITMGTWSKRFHICVLVGAEFFQRLLNSEFHERKKGSVEMIVGGYTTNLEAAIMFLYGVCPSITMGNIAHLLDLAEFLVIPNLKAFLVDWLKRQTVTQHNFIQFLHLASRYEFYLPNCEEYIRANLNTCFQNSDFVSLTEDSVMELLSDRTLVYAGSDLKLKFVLDWLRCRDPALSDAGREFIQLIDMEEVSPDLISEAQNDPVFQRCNIPIGRSWGQCPDRTVLFMKVDGLKNAFLVYDLDHSVWFRFPSAHVSSINRFPKDRFYTNKRAVIFEDITWDQSDQAAITIYDIESDSTTFTTLELDDKDLTYSSYCYNKGVVWAVFDSGRHYRRYKVSENVTVIYTMFSTLYKGTLNTNGGVTSMTPVVSFPVQFKRNICINELNSIACCREHETEKELYIFDSTQNTLDIVPITEVEREDIVCPTRSGFLFYNHTRVLDISRHVGQAVGSRYQIREIVFKENDRYRYLYVENMWIRYNLWPKNKYVEWVSHDTFTFMYDLSWQPMTKLRFRSTYHFMADAVKVVLPRSNLRCHAECPHCVPIEKEKNYYRPQYLEKCLSSL